MTAGEMSVILYTVAKEGLSQKLHLIRNMEDMSKQAGGYLRKK